MNEAVKNLTRSIRRVEPPRPLRKQMSDTKSGSVEGPLSLAAYNIESVDNLVILTDMVVEAIIQNQDSLGIVSAEVSSTLTNNINHLCKHLKVYGSQIEIDHKDQLDRACLVFRDAIAHGSLEYQARVNLLDVLELRLNQWQSHERSLLGSSNNENETFGGLKDLKNYVKNYSIPAESGYVGPDEVLRRSNRKTSKSPNKNHFKDEIVIRNSDSGRVMGIKGRRVHMIEQLSDTIISFQRVAPTAKERVVQITGANEENVSYATRLIGDTIRNNASPVPGMLSDSDSSTSSLESFPEELGGCDEFDGIEKESKSKHKDKAKSSSVPNTEPYLYKHKIILSNCKLTITGEDYTYVTIAKAVLDDYFSKLRQSAETNNCDDFSLESALSDHQSVHKSSPVLSPVKAAPESENMLFREGDLLPHSSLAENSASIVHLADTTEVLDLDAISRDDAINDTKKLDASTSSLTTSVDEVPITYTKEFMISCRASELSQKKPTDWDHISSTFPTIVKAADEVDVFEEKDENNIDSQKSIEM